MNYKKRLWVGATLLIVIALNYAIIGLPLIGKSISINNKYKSTLMSKARSGELFKNAEEDYILEVFRKEKSAVDRKILILNCVGLSLLVISASWVVFGLLFHRR